MVAKIQYDANLRTFKLVDSEFRTVLEGDGFLDVGIPLAFEEFELDDLLQTRPSESPDFDGFVTTC